MNTDSKENQSHLCHPVIHVRVKGTLSRIVIGRVVPVFHLFSASNVCSLGTLV